MSVLRSHLTSPQALFAALVGLCVLLLVQVLPPARWLEHQLFYARLPQRESPLKNGVLALQVDPGETKEFNRFLADLAPNTLRALGICNPELLQEQSIIEELKAFKARHQIPLVVASNYYTDAQLPTLHRAAARFSPGTVDTGYIEPVSIYAGIYPVQKPLVYRKSPQSPILTQPAFSTRLLQGMDASTPRDHIRYLQAPDGFSAPLSLLQLKRLPAQTLKNSVLLVGSPLSVEQKPVISALQTEAHALRHLLENEAYASYDLLNLTLCVLMIALSIVLFAFTLNWGLWVACGCVGTLLLSYLSVNILIFRLGHVWLELTGPLLCGSAALGTLVYYFQRTEGRTRQELLSTYRRHLPDKVVRELMDAPAEELGQNERRVVTVMFTDIEGFSRMGEELPPDQIINILNEYLSAMTEIIFANNGSLDKYIGDGIMAVYGNIGANDPAAYAYYAVKTALEMQEKMTELQKKWMKEGIRPIQIRIGINTGDALVGNVGHPKRKELTVIGDTVNTSARIERLNKQYNTHILISHGTYLYVKNRVDIEPLGEEQLKGKTTTVKVYHVKGWKP